MKITAFEFVWKIGFDEWIYELMFAVDVFRKLEWVKYEIAEKWTFEKWNIKQNYPRFQVKKMRTSSLFFHFWEKRKSLKIVTKS